MNEKRRVVIINASRDTCDMLEEYFRTQGFEAASVDARGLRTGAIDGAELMRTRRPDVIVVDIAIPYEPNWALLQRLRDDPAVTCPIVITTTNEAVVRRLVGTEEPLHEIVGKPYDLTRLHEAVMRELRGEAPAERPPDGDRRSAERRQRDRRRTS